MTRLDVGCGPSPRPGYLGVDIRQGPGIAAVCPAWEVSRHFREVDEVYSRHALEHLTFPQVERALSDWLLALRVGGSVEVIVPDLRFHLEQMLNASWTEREWEDSWSEARWASAGFWGWQRDGAPGEPYWDVHKSGFTGEALAFFLRRAGFSSVGCEASGPHLTGRGVKVMDPCERQIAPSFPGIRADHRARYRFAAGHLGKGRVLDLGCGVGYGSRILRDSPPYSEVTGVDRCPEAIDYAREFYCGDGITFLEGDVLNPPVAGVHSGCTALEILEHLESPSLALKAAWDLLEPGGVLVASTPNAAVLDAALYPFHVRHYSPGEFDSLIEGCGFLVEGRYSQEGETISPGDGGSSLLRVARKRVCPCG